MPTVQVSATTWIQALLTSSHAQCQWLRSSQKIPSPKKMWKPARSRYVRLLSLCALSTLLVFIVHQTMGEGVTSPHSLGDYLRRLRSSASLAMEPTKASVTTFRVTFPRLYASLKSLEGPPTRVNFTPSVAPAKTCQRPKSQSLIESLVLGDSQQTNPTTNVTEGGTPLWAPTDCWPPLSRTAVIVPYRNRSDNLDTFIPYMHRLLRRQNILFGLFVVEQANTKLFNRAKLINIGFIMAQRFQDFDCFVFQDADKLPENVANLYDCTNSPKLLISEMRGQGDASGKYKRGRLYSGFFGGTVAISTKAFLKVNGNSNRYYGWGREDDELSTRLGLTGYRIRYNTGAKARFVNLRHGSDIVTNTMPWPHAKQVRQTMKSDGLNSLNYTDMGIFVHPMFVLVRADV